MQSCQKPASVIVQHLNHVCYHLDFDSTKTQQHKLVWEEGEKYSPRSYHLASLKPLISSFYRWDSRWNWRRVVQCRYRGICTQSKKPIIVSFSISKGHSPEIRLIWGGLNFSVSSKIWIANSQILISSSDLLQQARNTLNVFINPNYRGSLGCWVLWNGLRYKLEIDSIVFINVIFMNPKSFFLQSFCLINKIFQDISHRPCSAIWLPLPFFRYKYNNLIRVVVFCLGYWFSCRLSDSAWCAAQRVIQR